MIATKIKAVIAIDLNFLLRLNDFVNTEKTKKMYKSKSFNGCKISLIVKDRLAYWIFRTNAS